MSVIIFTSWVFLMLLISFIPLLMLKKGNYMTGRDLFFTFIGVVIASSYQLMVLYFN